LIVTIKDKDVGINNMTTLLRKLSFIFDYQNKNIPNCEVNIESLKLDPVSALVIYKVFYFAFKHECLEFPKANLDHIFNIFSDYGIEKMMKKIINQEDADLLYKKIKPKIIEGFFIAPHAINRDSFKNKIDLEVKYTQYIANYYKTICPKLVQYFETCICEIASNFLYHALEDNNSILMARGNEKMIEIVCVDNSNGIITSLDPGNKDHKKVMMKAFERGVSSKKNNNHCGTGLWFIKQIAEKLNGTLRVYSEDMSYICKGKKVFVKNTPYWKGSIFYLKLYVTDSTEIDNFFNNFNKTNDLGLISE